MAIMGRKQGACTQMRSEVRRSCEQAAVQARAIPRKVKYADLQQLKPTSLLPRDIESTPEFERVSFEPVLDDPSKADCSASRYHCGTPSVSQTTDMLISTARRLSRVQDCLCPEACCAGKHRLAVGS
jgi:hypothetical protein